MAVVRDIVTRSMERLSRRANSRAIVLLAAVLALDSADKAAIGAMAEPLESAFGISKMHLGLLVTVSSMAGLIGLLPFGWLVDRFCRTHLLAVAVLIWGIVMVVCAAATTYPQLLVTRLGLGVIGAAAIPAVASLTGDFFPSGERARIYSYILAGEAIGTGLGFVVSGELALLSWRIGFLILALPTPLIAWLLYRLPEPPRGGAGPRQAENSDPTRASIIGRLIQQNGVAARDDLVSDENPEGKSLLWAIVYVLRVPTNVVLIIASALGYYFIAGLRVFGVEYVHNWFGVPHTAAIGVVVTFGVCGLAGVVAGGRGADYLLWRGHLNARVTVTVCMYLATVLFLLPVFLTRSIALMIPAIMLAGFCAGAINPPLDAAPGHHASESLGTGRIDSNHAATDRRGPGPIPLRLHVRSGLGPGRGGHAPDIPDHADSRRRQRRHRFSGVPHLSARCRHRRGVHPPGRVRPPRRRRPAILSPAKESVRMGSHVVQ